MRTSSLKAKGRRLAQAVKDRLLEWAPDLADAEIQVTPSGVNGPDLYISPHAQKTYPLVIECKNQEALSIWSCLKQTESHRVDGMTPILVFARNRTEPHVALKLEDFLRLIR